MAREEEGRGARKRGEGGEGKVENKTHVYSLSVGGCKCTERQKGG